MIPIGITQSEKVNVFVCTLSIDRGFHKAEMSCLSCALLFNCECESMLRKLELTLSCTMWPVRRGLIMPGRVATVLERPISMLANCGAMSK